MRSTHPNRQFIRRMIPFLACILIGCITTFSQVPAGRNRPAEVPEGYVITPFGYFHSSCVRRLAKGDVLMQDATVIQHADRTLTYAGACAYPHYSARGELISAGAGVTPPTIGHNWIVSEDAITSSAYGQITAQWGVPSAPKANNGQIIYLFPGLEDVNDVVSILQPVLGWNADFTAAWGIASWNCCPSGTANESSPVHVSTGDQIFGQVKSTCSAGTLTCPRWNVTTEDNNTVLSTTLSSTPNEGQTFNWAFAGALEVYNVIQCSNYPPNTATAFSVSLYNDNFSLITNPGWSLTNWAVGLTPQCNYGGRVSGGTATLIYGSGASLSPTGINFGTWDFNHGPVTRSLTLTNYGSSSISMSGFGVTDPFSVSGNTCGTTLAASATCTINVTLTPGLVGGAGTVTQTMSVRDSAPNSPQTSRLTAKITCAHGC